MRVHGVATITAPLHVPVITTSAWYEVAVVLHVDALRNVASKEHVASASLARIGGRSVPAARTCTRRLRGRAQSTMRLFCLVPFLPAHVHGRSVVAIDVSIDGPTADVHVEHTAVHLVHRRRDTVQRGLSFLLTFANHAATLPAVLDTLHGIVQPGDQVLCIDRASTDGSGAWVRKVCARYGGGWSYAEFGMRGNADKARRFAARLAPTTMLVHWQPTWIAHPLAMRSLIDEYALRNQSADCSMAIACRGASVLRSDTSTSHYLRLDRFVDTCCAIAKRHRQFDAAVQIDVCKRIVFTQIRTFTDTVSSDRVTPGERLLVRALQAAEACSDDVPPQQLVETLRNVDILPMDHLVAVAAIKADFNRA